MKDKILSVLKLFLAILLLPLAIGVIASFYENLRLMERGIVTAFGWGVIVYLLLHILLYEPAQVYDVGKKMTEQTMGFLSPFVKVAGFCIPIFTILSFAVYYVISLIWKEHDLFPYFVFLASFTFTMHIVFTANALKGKKAGAMKENYFYSIFLIFVVNMMIIAGAFALLSGEFSLLEFLKRCADVSGVIYTASFRQLFDVSNR